MLWIQTVAQPIIWSFFKIETVTKYLHKDTHTLNGNHYDANRENRLNTSIIMSTYHQFNKMHANKHIPQHIHVIQVRHFHPDLLHFGHGTEQILTDTHAHKITANNALLISYV